MDDTAPVDIYIHDFTAECFMSHKREFKQWIDPSKNELEIIHAICYKCNPYTLTKFKVVKYDKLPRKAK
jgi:hypothetical protein